MYVRKTASGKVDKRTKAGQAICARMAAARAARAGAKKRGTTSSYLKRTASGKVDKRTKEGKAICKRMAKARAARGSLLSRIKRLF